MPAMPRGLVQRILILGATENQIPVIEEVHRRGFLSVVADNNPRNPGHQLASESFLVSTTDSQALVSLGRELGIVGVVAHGSDPAAISAARVADALVLSGDSVTAVELVQDKITLRRLQVDLGLSAPPFAHATDSADVMDFLHRFPEGIIVKPADGSGSRGVSRLIVDSARESAESVFNLSLTESRSGRVIVEQLLPHLGIQLGGDIVVTEGTIRQACFTTQYMAHGGEGLAVTANLIPTTFDKSFRGEAITQLDTLIRHAGLRQGVYNFEFLPGRDGLPVLIDFGARSGGGLYGELFARSYGIDTVSMNIDFALGLPADFTPRQEPRNPIIGITLHSRKAGIFQRVSFSRELRRLIVKKFIGARPGDFVNAFENSRDRVGMVLASSSCREQLQDIAENVYDHFLVEVEDVQSGETRN